MEFVAGVRGLRDDPGWLSTDRVQGGCGGRTLKAQRTGLAHYTEEPVRQGRMDNPWAGVVGDVAEAVALFQRAEKNPGGQAEALRQAAARARPTWSALVGATESILGRPWTEMRGRHGDLGAGRPDGGGNATPGLEAGGGGAADAGSEAGGRGARDPTVLAAGREASRMRRLRPPLKERISIIYV